ncbi:unnamed protein product [Prunus armeniaca]
METSAISNASLEAETMAQGKWPWSSHPIQLQDPSASPSVQLITYEDPQYAFPAYQRQIWSLCNLQPVHPALTSASDSLPSWLHA